MTGPQSPAFDDDEFVPDAIRKAEEAVAALAHNFTEWMRADLDSALAALASAKDAQPDNAAHVREIFGVCHNMKGQGGSFGYELITQVGDSLCHYLHDAGSASPRMLTVIEAHLTAIKFVLDRDIQGDGGPVGEQLLAKLRSIAESVD